MDLLRAMELEDSEVDDKEYDTSHQELLDDAELTPLPKEWVDMLVSQREEQFIVDLSVKELATKTVREGGISIEDSENQCTQPSEEDREKFVT